MTKLILLALIIMLAFWLGKMSVSRKKVSPPDGKKEFKSPVIDITPEDK
ncbi:MAG TPA: hypothetical protein PKC29_08720 [Thermodesulfobacteriota bacterium]|nr:hypothetical protein [Thermodesulfobacteriota bacterium]